MHKCNILPTIFLYLLAFYHVVASTPIELFVSPSGSDSNNGLDVNNPFETLHHALEVTENSPYDQSDVVVTLLPGYYDLDSTLTITNHANRHVTVQAYKSWEVHVTGGRRIQSNDFHPVFDDAILQRLPAESRDKVMAVNLTEVGITDLGVMRSMGAYSDRRAPLEVFFNGEPLRLAQWPNEEFVNVMSIPDGRYGTRFTYEDDRPLRWSQENDLWAYGYWYWSWSDHSIKIQNIDTQTKTITLENTPNYGLRIGEYSPDGNTNKKYPNQGGYYRVINVLAELDQPGEYYVDRSSGVLYLWPLNGKRQIEECDNIYVSLLDYCIRVRDFSSNILIKGFSVEACRRYGISAFNVHSLALESMEIRNTGSFNFVCANCTNTSITKSYFHDGDGAIKLTGGDRASLTPSGNVIADNVMWRYARVAAVGYHAIKISGVGCHVHHNHISIGQYTGIWWSGNDHIMEYNHIHHTCMNSSDCGAIHSGRDWTWRGNVIRYNYIHHTLRFFPGASVRGIMLDDQYSSVLIQNNVFFNNEIHVNIGGGRDNIIRDNVFYNATEYPVHGDKRGVPSGSNDATLFARLASVPYQSPLWASRYPKLAAMTLDNAKYPEGNEITKNMYYDADKEDFKGNNVDNPDWFNVHDNIQSNGPSDFNNPDNYDFRPACLLKESLQYLNFVTPIPVSVVGPRYQIGPLYLEKNPEKFGDNPLPPVSGACTTQAPRPSTPRAPFLTDGSVSPWSTSTASAAYNIPNEGCWLRFEKCPNNASLEYTGTGTTEFYRDLAGETTLNTGTNEQACLERVPHYVTLCGTDSAFTVVFGPTGAMTLGGEGCFFAEYGCVRHGNTEARVDGIIHRDNWAEQNMQAAEIESNCISRALAQYRYCWNDESLPVTSIYRPTGRFLTAGGGCWIRITSCPGRPETELFFYDSWGATNANTDTSETSCYERAAYYWRICGADPAFPVTAYYRPLTRQLTYP